MAIWALWYFAEPMRAALNRIKEVGMSGVKLDDLPARQGVPTLPSIGTNTLPSNSQSAQAFIADIKQRLSADQLTQSVATMKSQLKALAGDDKELAVEVCEYALAAHSIVLAHERTYRFIFGSQMAALQKMNDPGGASPEAIKAIYDEAVKKFPDLYKNFSFENWLVFMTQPNGLAVSENQKYQLTAWGRGFLRYVLDNRLTPKLF